MEKKNFVIVQWTFKTVSTWQNGSWSKLKHRFLLKNWLFFLNKKEAVMKKNTPIKDCFFIFKKKLPSLKLISLVIFEPNLIIFHYIYYKKCSKTSIWCCLIFQHLQVGVTRGFETFSSLLKHIKNIFIYKKCLKFSFFLEFQLLVQNL